MARLAAVGVTSARAISSAAFVEVEGVAATGSVSVARGLGWVGAGGGMSAGLGDAATMDAVGETATDAGAMCTGNVIGGRVIGRIETASSSAASGAAALGLATRPRAGSGAGLDSDVGSKAVATAICRVFVGSAGSSLNIE
jgi:hypothetical protein